MPEVLTFRRRVLHLSISLMEAAWMAPLVMVLVPVAATYPLGLVILALWALVAGYGLLARYILLTTWSGNRVYALLVAVPLLSYIVAARLLLFPHQDLFSVAWLGAALLRPLYLLRPGPELGLLLAVVLAWWRGLDVTQLPERIAVLAFRFRVAILALVVALVLLASLRGQGGTPAVWTFFFASLMSLALVRVEEVGDLEGEAGRHFDRAWTALVVASTLVIVGLSALLTLVVTPENAARAFEVARPVLRAVGEVLFLVLAALGWLIGTVVMWLVRTVMANTEIDINFSPLQVPEAPKQAPPQPWRVDIPWLTWLARHAEQIAGGLAIALVLVLIAFGVRRELRRRRLVREEEIAAGDLGEVAADVGKGVRGLWQRLREAARLLRMYGPRARFLAALSVHNIYVNLLRLSAQHGLPRREAETPYEFLTRLTEAFPFAAEDARAITDAFVAAHYGELVVDEGTLDGLRAAWERIREGVSGER